MRNHSTALWNGVALIAVVAGTNSVRAFAPIILSLSSETFSTTTSRSWLKAMSQADYDDYEDEHITLDDSDSATSTNDRERMLQSLGLDPRNNDALLEYSIDSFLRGDYDRPFADDAVAPLPGLSPQETVEQALRALRQLDEPEPSHGAACFLRFCVPLRRGERWSPGPSAWKELLRGSLTPTMLARRLRASREFCVLLDWDKMDVTQGAVTGKDDFALEDSVAFVSAALYFGVGNVETNDNTNSEATTPPELLQIKLSRVGGVWLIESIQRIPKSLFQNLAAPSEDEKPVESKQTKPRKGRKPRK
jgi:hypothetical protein